MYLERIYYPCVLKECLPGKTVWKHCVVAEHYMVEDCLESLYGGGMSGRVSIEGAR